MSVSEAFQPGLLVTDLNLDPAVLVKFGSGDAGSRAMNLGKTLLHKSWNSSLDQLGTQR